MSGQIIVIKIWNVIDKSYKMGYGPIYMKANIMHYILCILFVPIRRETKAICKVLYI